MPKFRMKLSLSQKIVLPFLSVCLGVFMLGLFTLGQWFTENLAQNLYGEVAIFADRVSQDFQYDRQTLETQASLIASQNALMSALEQRDRKALLKTLIPLKSELALDWVAVVDTQGSTAIDLRNSTLSRSHFLDKSVVKGASSGANFSELVDVPDSHQVLLTVSYPIKSPSGLLGGLIVGHLVDDKLLQKIAAGSSKHLITVRSDRIVAATLPIDRELPWTPPSPATVFVRVKIDRKTYLAKSFVFSGASQSLLTTVLYPTSVLDSAKWQLWLRLGFLFFLVAIIVSGLGIWISRTITQPLRTVTQIAQKVTQEANFDLQAPVTTQDEVGIVAISLNQLIRQVKSLLAEQQDTREKLEAYSQTLEKTVAERTYELQKKNIDLYEMLVELRHTQTQMIQSEKMSSLGQLVAGVAHEINNPVNFIYGNLKHASDYTQELLQLIALYQQHYPNPEPEIQQAADEMELEYIIDDLPKTLHSMKIGAERIHGIVLSLRLFSRLDEAEFKTIDLYEGIESTLLILQHRLKPNPQRPEIEVIKDFAPLPPIECYPGQLNQVFMNILANAIDALEEAHTQEICPHPSIRITSEQVDNRVILCISDNGAGIPKEIQIRLFDPFFTTKPVGKGTGMGLSICYQIVTERHRGTLRCFSSPEQGTTFEISIPIKQGS
jgi:two-component system, NtrC family, sensor kinase